MNTTLNPVIPTTPLPYEIWTENNKITFVSVNKFRVCLHNTSEKVNIILCVLVGIDRTWSSRFSIDCNWTLSVNNDTYITLCRLTPQILQEMITYTLGLEKYIDKFKILRPKYEQCIIIPEAMRIVDQFLPPVLCDIILRYLMPI